MLLVALAEPALATETVHYETRPDGVRLSPGESELVFFRANDAVTYSYCDDETGTCVAQSVTCAEASEDWRTMQEAAEAAWLALFRQDHWTLRAQDPDAQLPFDLADLLELVKPVLPLKYYFLNPAIAFADPPNPDGGLGDPATHRDPSVTSLLEELFTDPDPDNSEFGLVDDIEVVEDLYLSSDDPNADPQSIADALPPDLRDFLDAARSDPVNNSVPPEILEEIRQALRVEISDDVEATLSYLNANIVNTGWPERMINIETDTLEDMPHTLAYRRGDLLHGLVELLGLPGFDVQHVDDVHLLVRHGVLKRIPAEWAVARMAERCGKAAVLENQSVQFVGALSDRDTTLEDAFASDQIDATREFGSIAPVNGQSAERARHVLGGSLWWTDQDLLQDDNHNFFRGPWKLYGSEPRVSNGSSRYVLNRSHVFIRRDPVRDVWQQVIYGSDITPGSEIIIRTISGGVSPREPNLMSPYRQRTGTKSTESTMGGVIAMTGKELGEEVVRHCVGNVTTGSCEEWANIAVVVEPEGWDDARVMGVDDPYRLVVNRVSGRVALLGESADGDVTIGGTVYEVLERLCCLPGGDAYWSLDLELPVMENDRVVFFRADHPLNKSGNQVLLGALVDEDSIVCPGTRYCTHIRPRPATDVSPGAFGLTASAHYTSLELTVSAPVGTPNVTSERRSFDYCLAHRENTCSGSPPACARATYLESPRAPNAPDLVGVESSGDLAATHFAASTLCEGMTGTVTVTVNVYDDPSPPDIPEEVWEEDPATDRVRGPRLRCYDREQGGWAQNWRLAPASADDRLAPSWCDLPPRSAMFGADGRYRCQGTRPDTYSGGKVGPAPESRWYSAMHLGAFEETGWVRVGADRLFLVGHRLTEGAGAMCNDAHTRIVGVWPTHVGAENWIMRGARQDDPCTEEYGFDTYGEESCVASQGMLWQSGPSGGLGDSWHWELDNVEPCVGEAECDVWVPPVPGWYQVRIRLQAPRTTMVFGRDDHDICHDVYLDIHGPPQFTTGSEITMRPLDTNNDLDWTCEVSWRSYYPEEAHHVERPMSRGVNLVFDELIWVEEPYLVRR
ncbi:MAG: hypothetical protein F4121_09200 [Acidimicrobiia bacterium]|nr:hypothetical protein [Acidimicrobiia bacterium]MYC45364.1 hypothetical protein [Acidimicrobiia bacterium]MYI20225.1 hypothetical protein [Acidimicrobiia bacterium]